MVAHCRHTANGQVSPKQVISLLMNRFIKRLAKIVIAHQFNERVFAAIEKKLFEAQRKHVAISDATDGYRDLLQREFEQRPGSNDMKVGHLFVEVAQGRYRFGTVLNFVKKQKCLAGTDAFTRQGFDVFDSFKDKATSTEI